MKSFPFTPFQPATWIMMAVFFLCGAANAGSNWWKDEWTLRKKITLDTTASGLLIAEPIGATAVLLRLHAGNFHLEAAREDGSDLRFVAEDNKTVLPHHIEKYDVLMGEAFVWVRVPDVPPSAKTGFWLYYGNRNPQMEKAEDAKGTYDADTVLVYHFNERGMPPADASGNGNHAQNAGVAVNGSFIGSGVRLDEKTALTIPVSDSLRWSEDAPVTISAWIKPATLPARAILFRRRAGTTNLVVGVDNGIPFVEISKGAAPQRAAAAAPITAGAWRHFALVATSSSTTLYVDGESMATVNSGLPAMNSEMQIGVEGFNGEVDEFQIANVARPLGFIRLAALGQGEKGNRLLTLGPDEEATSWFSGGYLGIIIKSLTVDGWVAIVLLAIMSMVSWWVMIGKWLYLSGVTKGNAAFLKTWHKVAADLAVLGNADEEQTQTMGGRLDKKQFRAVRRSPIYRLYGMGMEELRDRLAADKRKTKTLSAQSVQAIRSVLDGGLVRESQKLNAKMVLLTIAISGGPFIGLLGTVAGVMITFAGVAQEGEVNVPGIAPGISAALLATVAGLGVAIPALFGYNYLLTRVKDAVSDMHVFIDEFVTKLAECYSGTNGEVHADDLSAAKMDGVLVTAAQEE